MTYCIIIINHFCLHDHKHLPVYLSDLSDLSALSVYFIFARSAEIRYFTYFGIHYYYCQKLVSGARLGESGNTVYKSELPNPTQPTYGRKKMKIVCDTKNEQIRPTWKHWLCSYNPQVPHTIKLRDTISLQRDTERGRTVLLGGIGGANDCLWPKHNE